jgi:hypothetical protein
MIYGSSGYFAWWIRRDIELHLLVISYQMACCSGRDPSQA